LCTLSQRFIHYTTVVAPDYKTKFFVELEKRIHGYMLEPILLYAIRAISSIRVSSYSFQCEIEHWGISNDTSRLRTLYPKQVRESKYPSLL
jgi:hypothetical protein